MYLCSAFGCCGTAFRRSLLKKTKNLYMDIDFVIDNGSDIFPVEVKAEADLQAKSLKVYREKFHPNLAIRLSMSDYKKEEWLLNLSLYGVQTII